MIGIQHQLGLYITLTVSQFYSIVAAKTVTLQQCNLADMLIRIYNNAQSRKMYPGGEFGPYFRIACCSTIQSCADLGMPVATNVKRRSKSHMASTF